MLSREDVFVLMLFGAGAGFIIGFAVGLWLPDLTGFP